LPPADTPYRKKRPFPRRAPRRAPGEGVRGRGNMWQLEMPGCESEQLHWRGGASHRGAGSLPQVRASTRWSIAPSPWGAPLQGRTGRRNRRSPLPEGTSSLRATGEEGCPPLNQTTGGASHVLPLPKGPSVRLWVGRWPRSLAPAIGASAQPLVGTGSAASLELSGIETRTAGRRFGPWPSPHRLAAARCYGLPLDGHQPATHPVCRRIP